jgi:hypothetical protein
MKPAMALLIPLLSGCVVVAAAMVGAAVAVGTYAYVEGEGRQEYSVSVKRAYEGSLKVCDECKFAVVEKSQDEFGARVVARRADNTEVRFSIEKTGEDLTRVGIRVGVFGDEPLTLELHRKLGQELEGK